MPNVRRRLLALVLCLGLSGVYAAWAQPIAAADPVPARRARRGGEGPRLACVGLRVVTGGILAVPFGPFTGAQVDVRPDRWVDVRRVDDRDRGRG